MCPSDLMVPVACFRRPAVTPGFIPRSVPRMPAGGQHPADLVGELATRGDACAPAGASTTSERTAPGSHTPTPLVGDLAFARRQADTGIAYRGFEPDLRRLDRAGPGPAGSLVPQGRAQRRRPGRADRHDARRDVGRHGLRPRRRAHPACLCVPDRRGSRNTGRRTTRNTRPWSRVPSTKTRGPRVSGDVTLRTAGLC